MNRKKRTKRLYIEVVGANDRMIVRDKQTFEEWFVYDEFSNENITVSGDSKAYIDDLIKKQT